MDIPYQISLFDMIEQMPEKDKEVEIKGAIHPHVSLKEIENIRLSYGDLTLIVAMLRDYVKGLDEVKKDDIQWQVYYRNKFWDMAEKISLAIGYDYDAQVKKCQKKHEKENDIGEDALILALKKGAVKSEPKEESKQEGAEGEAEGADVRPVLPVSENETSEGQG